jgi:hypothetical protein
VVSAWYPPGLFAAGLPEVEIRLEASMPTTKTAFETIPIPHQDPGDLEVSSLELVGPGSTPPDVDVQAHLAASGDSLIVTVRPKSSPLAEGTYVARIFPKADPQDVVARLTIVIRS